MTGVAPGQSRPPRKGKGKGKGEQPMVPDAEFASYYDKPIINQPVWSEPDIPGYLFLGGLAGAASVLAAGADLTRRPVLAVASKLGATGAVSLAFVALVHDLGRPKRFLNMLRVFKVTSPMSMGSWLLSAYAPLAGAAALSGTTGRAPRLGRVATMAAAVLGPGLAAYTAVLIADTAVPAWHDGYREMPYIFVGSGATAAAGLAMLAAPLAENGPARRLAGVAAVAEVGAIRAMERRLGMVADPYHEGNSGRLLRAGEVLGTMGAIGAALMGGRSRAAAAASGAALLTASALSRFAIFRAGLVSANDPRYTVVPQRQRLSQPGSSRPPGDLPLREH